jgi:hypothetical protein
VSVWEANYEDIVERYYHSTGAHSGELYLLKRIESGDSSALDTMLRSHEEEGIYKDSEVQTRDDVDALLNFYGILELCLATRFVVISDASPILKNARRILNNKHVRCFYSVFYPVRLPQMLRLRMDSRDLWAAGVDSEEGRGLVSSFLSLDMSFQDNLEDGMLLALLDDFWIHGVRYDDFVKIISNPEAYIQKVLTDPEGDDVLAHAVREFGVFVRFSIALRNLLSRSRDQPMLQSGIWSYYGYWFETMREKLMAKLRLALAALGKWSPEMLSKEANEEMSGFVAETLSVLEDLTSPKYARRIDEMLKSQ